MNKTIPQKILFAFAVSFLILVIIGSLIYFNLRNFLNSNMREAHTYQVLTILENVMSDLKDIESGTRGFFITGQEEFLEPYNNAQKLLRSDLSTLRLLISDDQSQISHFNSLEVQIHEKLKFHEKQVELRRASNTNVARAQIASGAGKRLMDEIRRTTSDMKYAENDLLSQRIKKREASTLDVFVITGITVLILAALVFIVMTQLKKEFTVRERHRDSLQESLEYSNMIIDTVPNPILVLDADLNIITENRSFYMRFKYEKKDIEGKSFFEVIRGKSDHRELRKLLLSVIPEDFSFDRYELELIDNRVIWMNARKLFRPHNNVHLILVGIDDITDKKRIEAERAKLLLELETEQERLSSIMAQMPSGVSITEALSGKLLYQNQKAVELLGHSMLVSEDYTHFVRSGAMHDYGIPYKPEEYPITRALSGETVYGEEILYRRGDGAYTYFSVNASPLFDRDGNIIAAICTFEDISQKKEVERALRESEERFSAAFRTNPDAIVISLVEDGTILDVNDSFLLLFGWKREDIIGKSSLSLEMYADSEDRKKAIEMLRLKGNLRNFQIAIKSRSGERRTALLSAEILHLNKKKAFLTTIRDITELKQAEEALKKNQKNLLDAQKLAHMGNYTIEVKNNNKIEWSDELYEIWEVERNQPIPPFEQLWDKIHPDDRQRLESALTEKDADGDHLETEFRIMFPDGRIKYIQIITRLEFDESGSLLRRQGVEIDITERKLAQLELEKSLNDLERSNNELEQFAYIASHDLQEPLRMVSSYLKLLLQKYEGMFDEKARRYIEFAVDGAMRMSNLIKGLLSYSRLTTHAKAPQQVDLNRVVGNVMNDLKTLIEENMVAIDVGKLPVLKADEVQMNQLFQNLITNAIKFKNQKKPEIKICVREENKHWLFSVNDNGIGIEPEFFDRIFILFQRLHERDMYPGTGLGLAICKKIVERHGGKIWVESEVGKGTTFYFTFPC
ncbi:MAG: PAS domain S-box protein [Ignavibacteria bacterium]|nr:PAS domain S-box protein [Ignavibacteria bacterium]MCU7502241.1 PAS domain S-box protein [Ignavibacteria bacterium]MCU7516715.1 PAS domain S-box protein [Ignavibacteria bacterium]